MSKEKENSKDEEISLDAGMILSKKIKTHGEIQKIIQVWWASHVHDSPISRDTATYNYFSSIMEKLLNDFSN